MRTSKSQNKHVAKILCNEVDFTNNIIFSKFFGLTATLIDN